MRVFYTIRNIEIAILYLSYFLFLVSIPFNTESNLVAYITNFIFAMIILIYVLLTKNIFEIKINMLSIIFILIYLFIIALFPLGYLQIYTLIFYLKVFFIILFFLKSKITILDLVRFINLTYLLYLFLSCLVYFNLMPPISGKENFFDESVGGFDFISFYGVEGSTADIDSYSGLVLLVNLFFIVSKGFRYVFVFLSMIVLLMTTRLTPIISVAVALFAFLVIKKRLLAVFFILISFLFFIGTILLSGLDERTTISFMGIEMPLKTLLILATHGRSLVWHEQINILIDKYSFLNYIYGRFDDSFEVVIAGWKAWVVKNPHNSYLYSFYRSPLLFTIGYFILIKFIYIRFNPRTFPVILFILLACYTNVTIFGVHNPTFLITVLFLLVKKNVLILQPN